MDIFWSEMTKLYIANAMLYEICIYYRSIISAVIAVNELQLVLYVVMQRTRFNLK